MSGRGTLVDHFERHPRWMLLGYVVAWSFGWSLLALPRFDVWDLATGATLGLITWGITSLMLWGDRNSEWPPRGDVDDSS